MEQAKTGRARFAPCLGVLTGLALLTSLPAKAETAVPACSNPNALGTTRTIVVDPREHPRIGTMQYAETLPLRDKEVVLTFDDGPIPKHSNAILDILASECVRATFFAVGRMAQEHPDGVRKLIALGHSVGTHTQNHPLNMRKMPIEQARAEIDQGIASVTAALGDAGTVSPFLRIPGLSRAAEAEDYIGSLGIQTWSADFPADDWRHVSSKTVHDLAMSRLKAKGKGILLLHDIQPRTVAALPAILRDLKAGGYHIVHVEAATLTRPATPTEPQDWQLHPVSETVAISHWPKVPGFAFAHAEMLPAPKLTAADQMLTLTRHAAWPAPTEAAAVSLALLPVPGKSLFQIAERHHKPIRALLPLPHHAEERATTQTAENGEAGAVRRTIPGAIPPGLTPGR